jgi:integrase
MRPISLILKPADTRYRIPIRTPNLTYTDRMKPSKSAKTSKPEFMLASDYEQHANSDSTKIAYQKDLDRFLAWGGAIPSTPEQIAAYLSEHAGINKAATLARWMASISIAHQKAGIEDSPTQCHHVRAVMAGIKRTHGAEQRRVSPICSAELVAIVNTLKETPVDQRNKALLLLAFGGALRRSEAVKLNVSDFRFNVEGMRVNLGATKTDQTGADSRVAIPYAADKKYCAIHALKAWLHTAGIKEGPVFRSLNRYGTVGKNSLSTQAFADIVKSMVVKVGLDPSDFSGHSLRAGLATSAAAADKPYHKIKAITRHKSDAMLARYIRDGEDFKDNAGALL